MTPPVSADKVPQVDSWLQSVLWESTLPAPADSSPESLSNFEIHRLKGILRLEDGSSKIIQAVRDVFEIRDSEPTQSDDGKPSPVQCKIVLIGRGLGPTVDPWRDSFEFFVHGR